MITCRLRFLFLVTTFLGLAITCPFAQDYYVDELNEYISDLGLSAYVQVDDIHIVPSRSGALGTVKLEVEIAWVNQRVDHNFEKRFFQKYNMTLWERLMFGFSNRFKLPISKIVVTGLAPESGTIFCTRLRNGRVQSEEGGWTSAYAQVEYALQVPQSLAPAHDISVTTQEVPIARIKTLVERYYTLKGGKITVVDQSSNNHRVIVVRNLRGVVIRGQPHWEKLYLYVFTWQTKEKCVCRILGEGFLASGLGSYPSDSRFVDSMEPKYYQQLSEHIGDLASYVREHLSGG